MAEKANTNKEHPLAGIVLCFTSILPEQRTELATIAGQMGATHKYDLTSDVTHLIVGETNTAKYKFVARERADVTVLKPEWIEAVRQSWMEGGDTDIRALELEHRLPTFAGLAICITGFEDMTFRNHIQSTTNANGAEFKKDLTKSVTHLIARNTDGQKYKFATQWNIKVVTMKWFNESLERGMVLEETLYHPLLPEEQQGAGAWNRSIPTVKAKAPENENPPNHRPRKLRRVASAKLGDQNEGIWGDIVGMGSQPKEGSQKFTRRESIVQEARSFASETTFAGPQGSRQQSTEATNSRDGFLHDCFFFVYGFSSKQTNVLRHHLSFNGAQLVDSMSEFSRPDIPKRGSGLYIIVSHKIPSSQIPSTDDSAFDCEIVTDMWLERCLDAKSLVPPESHVANTPVRRFPIPGFHETRVCSTGFSRIDLLHLSKLVNLIGASYNEYLTPSASVLVCNDPNAVNQDKLRHTSEWGVPAVTADWLWNSIRREQKQSFDPYLIRRPSSQKPTAQSTKGLEMRASSRPEKRPLENPNDRNKVEDSPTKAQKTGLIQSPDSRGTPSDRRSNSLQENIPRKSKQDISQKPSSEPQPQSKSKPPSPSKTHNHLSSAESQPQSEPTTTSAELATVSGFLKQAREANSRSNSDPTEQQQQHPNNRRKRKPLLGRATSNTSSARTNALDHHQQQQRGFSRASSIDTLNEDGYGSAIESINTDGGGIPSLANSGRFEYAEDEQHLYREEKNEPESPPMTQLHYEDPDALAMREKFLSHAGKLADKASSSLQNKTQDQNLVMGEVKDLENAGWGTGRRTRNANKVLKDL
ncbi:protein kinase activating protein dpb11 [Aspergillus melleus]|uniref:Protein kinase activating protein dpb11 n=1 Tax=Aspergillus melleus TaxID=138277 RepID=A0ACC3ALJ6_9EURO|nr:protein kinase activating protein dpb11 [Aspergillus melleus]